MAAGEIFPIFFLALRNIIQSLCTGHCLHLQHMLKVTDSGSTFGRLLKKIGKAARNKERNGLQSAVSTNVIQFPR